MHRIINERMYCIDWMNECSAMNEWMNHNEWLNISHCMNKLMNIYIFLHWEKYCAVHSCILFISGFEWSCFVLDYCDMHVFVLWIVWHFVQFSSVNLVIDCFHSKSCWMYAVERALTWELWLRSEKIHVWGPKFHRYDSILNKWLVSNQPSKIKQSTELFD